MDIKDVCNAGGDILDAVADAINRNDFSGLSQSVSNTVNRVAEQVKNEVNKGSYGNPTHRYGQTSYTKQGQRTYQNTVAQQNRERYRNLYTNAKAVADTYRSANTKKAMDAYRSSQNAWQTQRQMPATVTRKPAGRISGPIQLAWGILATCGFGITALVMTILMLTQAGTVFTVLSAVFCVLTLGSITDIVRGSRKIGLVNRFYRYVRLIGTKGYIAITELAAQTGRSNEQVLRDLRQMMRKHMFLQGRLDAQQTTFMITQEAYEQYAGAEQERRAREAQESAYQQHARAQEQEVEQSAAYDAKTKKILSDGHDYIRMVHECNEKIPDEQMSLKLSRLEAIMQRIFEQVKRNPASADDLHKFMDYYLPTTTKLLHAYIDLDRQEIAGENISETKREIAETLDTINVAFEKLLDGLFEDTAWDISSDISVMKTMMAQEGLTGEQDFKLDR